MAEYISGMGFSGVDHPNSMYSLLENGVSQFLSGKIGQYFSRQAAEDSMQNQMEYDLWSARKLYPVQWNSQLDTQLGAYHKERDLTRGRVVDAVANNRLALEKAGYNPLLAVDGAGTPGATAPILSMPNGRVAPTSAGGVSGSSGGHGVASAGNPFMIASARQELINQQKQGDLLSAQIKQLNALTLEIESRTNKIEEETHTEQWKTPLKVFGRIWDEAGNEDKKVGSVKDLASRMVDYFRSTNGSRNSASTLNRQAREFYPNTPRSTMFFLNK